MTHTYPIAIGMEVENHEEVEKQFAMELQKLRSGALIDFYHGGVKKMVRVYFDLFCSLQDQPERRSANYVMLGGSKYTARWGMAGDFAAVASGIPSCSVCLSNLLQGLLILCENCVNWDTESRSGLLDFYPPKDYPSSEIPSSGKLSPMRLTYSTMKEAVVTTHDNFVNGDWTNSNARTFLQVHGINKEASDAIMERAKNCLSLSIEQEYYDREGMNADYVKIIRQRQANPELFERWNFPSLWDRGVNLEQHIDVAMHLVFLGIIKSTILKIQDWCILRGKHSAFVVYSNGIFESVQKYGLNWCRCMPYKKGGLGGWVSENYLAAARLCQWFYGVIDLVVRIDKRPTFVANDRGIIDWSKRENKEALQVKLLDSYPLPSCVKMEVQSFLEQLSFRQWNSKENKKWLDSRGLDSVGKAAILKERVLGYMEQDGGPPFATIIDGGDASNVHDVICSLLPMVSRIMQRTVSATTIMEVDRHIKLFLSKFHNFDVAMTAKKSTDKRKPAWLSSYNFICLTNLPSMIRKYGPIRNLWEGGGQGEKILQLIKPRWHGYRKNWAKNMLDNVLKQMAMSRVEQRGHCDIDDLNYFDDEEEDEENSPSLRADWSKFSSGNQKFVHRYKNMSDVVARYRNGYPVSVICTSEDKFLCLLRTNNVVEICRIGLAFSRGGAAYHTWSIAAGEDTFMGSLKVRNFCLLLPALTRAGKAAVCDNLEMRQYTVIDSEWNVMQTDGTLSLPKVNGCKYT
jgi:hypothetical protein